MPNETNSNLIEENQTQNAHEGHMEPEHVLLLEEFKTVLIKDARKVCHFIKSNGGTLEDFQDWYCENVLDEAFRWSEQCWTRSRRRIGQREIERQMRNSRRR